jgi:hypothetical protein
MPDKKETLSCGSEVLELLEKPDGTIPISRPLITKRLARVPRTSRPPSDSAPHRPSHDQ